MSFDESGVRFDFFDNAFIKFDEEPFYCKRATAGRGKAVDFLIDAGDSLTFLEVKNLSKRAEEDYWRVVCENKARPKNVWDADSLDLEVLEKVRGTLTALVGAKTFGDEATGREFSPASREFIDKIDAYFSPADSPKINVVLLLEGAARYRSNPFEAISIRLRNRLKINLRWLNCDVAVVDCATVGGNAVCRRIFAAAPVANV